MTDVADDMIILKIKRAHSAPQKDPNQYFTPGPLPIIAKFTDQNFLEQVKSKFIKAARDSLQQHPNQTIYVLVSIYVIGNSSPKQRNTQTQRIKRDDRTIQAYDKHHPNLMAKKSGERLYFA